MLRYFALFDSLPCERRPSDSLSIALLVLSPPRSNAGSSDALGSCLATYCSVGSLLPHCLQQAASIS
eukprot:scaffold40_cov413-Prasinococcus_capsulatus_cf.AAC.17